MPATVSVTVIPIFPPDSPCYSPLTPLAKPVVAMILTVLILLYYICFYPFFSCLSVLFGRCQSHLFMSGYLIAPLFEVLGTIHLTPQMAALKSSSEIDIHVLMLTLDSLDEDHELEHFFSGLPGFHNSHVLKQPLHGLDDQQRLRLLEAVIRLLDRTFSTSSSPDQVRHRRAEICDNATKLLDTHNVFPGVVRRFASEDGYGPLQSAKTVDFVRRLGGEKCKISPLDHTILSIVVARVQQRDDSWFLLASDQLDIPYSTLRSHSEHEDNLSFAIFIYVTRKQFNHFGDSSWPEITISGVLSATSKFNVQDTSPDLQNEFCALWNRIVRKAQNDKNRKISKHILKPIRHVYIRLHQGTNSAPTYFSASTGEDQDILDDPDSYPLCTDNDYGHDESSVATPDSHDEPSLSPASLAGPAAPSFPLPAPFRVDEGITTVPLHDNSRITRQTTQSFHFPVTSPDPASAGAMRDPVLKKQKSKTRVIVTPAPQPATEASAIRYPPSASVPPVAVLQPNVIPLTPPVPQTLPTPASSAPALDNTLLTGPSLSFLLPRLHLTSHPSQCFITATTRDPPSATRAMRTNNATTLDMQALPPLVTDSDEAIPGSSVQELDNGQTGGPSSFTSPV